MAAPSGLRKEYDREVLLEAQAERDPFVQLGRWFEEAAAGEIYEPNAMALATVAADGRPSLRMVLLKGMDERGLSFFTNLESRKAQEIAANPNAALLFWWDRLHRQVRVEGTSSRSARTRRKPTSRPGPMAAGSAPGLRRRAG